MAKLNLEMTKLTSKRRGRPTAEGGVRDIRVKFRVNEVENDRLTYVANRHDATIAETLRMLVEAEYKALKKEETDGTYCPVRHHD